MIVPLESLPYPLLKAVLFKLSNPSLVRLRRTSSSMDSLVEKHRNKLGSRCDIGEGLSVECKLDKKGSLCVTRLHAKINVKNGLSAISVKSVHINPSIVYPIKKERMSRLIKAFRGLDLSYDAMHCEELQGEQLAEFVTLSKARKRIRIFCCYAGVEYTLKALEKVKNRSKISFHGVQISVPIRGLCDLIKDFQDIVIQQMTVDALRSLFLEIVASPSIPTQFDATFSVPKDLQMSPFLGMEQHLPNVSVLFDRKRLPKRNQENARHRGDFFYTVETTPGDLVLVSMSQLSSSTTFSFRSVSSTLDVLYQLKIRGIFCVDERSLVEEYLKSSETDRMEILHSAFARKYSP